jgi:hypothetical protein
LTSDRAPAHLRLKTPTPYDSSRVVSVQVPPRTLEVIFINVRPLVPHDRLLPIRDDSPHFRLGLDQACAQARDLLHVSHQRRQAAPSLRSSRRPCTWAPRANDTLGLGASEPHDSGIRTVWPTAGRGSSMGVVLENPRYTGYPFFGRWICGPTYHHVSIQRPLFRNSPSKPTLRAVVAASASV